MATNKRRRLAIALAVSAAAVALAAPAGAQFAGGRAAFDQRPRPEPAQFHDFFRMPWGGGGGYPAYPSYPSPQYNPFYPRQQVYEPTKPPPPRKVETPPAETILVIGDSLADWLGYGLEETFADTPEVGIVRKIKPTSGLVRYEGHADGPDWAQAVKDMLATEKPAAIVVMLGINDRLPLRERAPDKEKEKDKKGAATVPSTDSPADAAATPDAEQPGSVIAAERDRRSPTGYYEFHTDKWAELYEKRIDDMIAALKSKGVPVIWVGLPAVRGAKSTSDMSYLDELYRAHAEKAGIVYVDPWDGFVDEKGQFTLQGPDFEGQIRRLRTSDGVNFTKAGGEKLAHYAEHDLRRLLTSHAIPVALPGPEEQAPAKGSARPAIGPIVPLNVTTGGEGGDLLGAGGHPAQHDSDPVATRVLSHGEAIAAPHGRADDFSWPRPDAGAAADLTAAPVTPAPPGPAGKGAAGKTETKSDAAKTEAKKSSEAQNDKAGSAANPTSNAAAAKPRRPGTAFDGAPPRPPLPLGPSRN
jgi:hypothetical protein